MPATAPQATVPLGAEPPVLRLLWAANAVLPLVPHLRASGFVADLERLRQKLEATLQDFDERARRGGIAATRRTQAHAVLAALLDHVVLSMPWGADAGWQPLGNVAAAAPRTPAQRVLAVAAATRDEGVREIIGVALALGFERRSSAADAATLEQIRTHLKLGAASAADGARARESAPAVERGSAFGSWLPLWVSTLAAGALLAALYFGLQASLSARSDRLYLRMAGLHPASAAAPRDLPAPQPRLADVLAAPAAEHRLTVRDALDTSVVVVPAAQLFTPGEAQLSAQARPLLGALAAALQHTVGRLQVIGHTDGAEPRSAQFASQWDLSVARARAVVETLQAAGIPAPRMTYDGRADVEPLRGNGPGGGSNARVEIVLLAGR